MLINETQSEQNAMGNGQGLKKRPKDKIDDAVIEKILELCSTSQLSKVVDGISFEVVTIADKIIGQAKEKWQGKNLNSIYVLLNDRCSFAIERHRQGDICNVQ